MPYVIKESNKDIIIFEDVARNQTIQLTFCNDFHKRMKFSWETTLPRLIQVEPACAQVAPGDSQTFDIQFFGEAAMEYGDSLDWNHSLRMWKTPVENRKRALEESECHVPVIFAIHRAPIL